MGCEGVRLTADIAIAVSMIVALLLVQMVLAWWVIQGVPRD